MATATKDKKSKAKVLELKNMIGGKFVDPAEGEMEDVTNPANQFPIFMGAPVSIPRSSLTMWVQGKVRMRPKGAAWLANDGSTSGPAAIAWIAAIERASR